MNLRRKGIKDIFTKLKKEDFGIWFSGIDGEGEFKSWHENGQIWQHFFYKDGDVHGEYKNWYVNGRMAEHSFYKNGERDGEYKVWHANGQMWRHAFYKDGEIVKRIK